ncbi:hypothetical protein D3C86_1951270 [compost metagenome]
MQDGNVVAIVGRHRRLRFSVGQIGQASLLGCRREFEEIARGIDRFQMLVHQVIV